MTFYRTIHFCRLLLLVVATVLAPIAIAAQTLDQYQHRAFTAADGAPDDIVAIGQDRDGMLWLAASAGIFTFDGQRFTPYPVNFADAPRQPYFLRGDPAGGVWIGWKRGGVTQLKNGQARHFDVADGAPGGSVWGFAFDQSGHVWAAAMNGVARFDGQRWHTMDARDGFDAAGAAAVVVDPAGNVGVFTEKGLYILRPGATRFDAPIGKLGTRQPPATGPQGQLYFIEKSGIRRIASLARYDQPDFPQLYRETGQSTGSFLADRNGGVWFDSEAGLHRVARPDAASPVTGQLRADTESITQATGLSSNIVCCMFEDSQRNVWVATSRGLDRFRPSDVTTVTLNSVDTLVQTSVIATGDDGGVWLNIALPRRAWVHIDGAGAITRRHEGEFNGPAVRDGATILAVEGHRRVLRLGNDTRQPFGPDLPKRRVSALARDAHGAVWVALSGGSVVRGTGAAWMPVAGLPRGRVTTLHADASGAVWIGYLDNRIVKVEPSGITHYGAAQGLAIGPVGSIAGSGATVWVAGARGLQVLHAGKITTVSAAPGMFDDLIELHIDTRGGLWLTGRAGLMYLNGAQLGACVAACPAQVTPALFNNADGIRGRSMSLSQSQLAQDGLHRIWVGTSNGAFRIDRAMNGVVAPAPHALVTSATSTGQQHDGSAPLLLPAGTHDVQIDYTAPVLDTPERVRFRYRLAGYDRDWQDAGARRQAFYTGLGPGRYRFDVEAAQGNSAWSAQPGSRLIDIAPAWYQTWWFRIAAAVTLLLLLAAGYRWRVLQLTRRVREQDAARQQERERIARELHDTVLQTNFALLLQVRAVAATAAGDPLGQRLAAIVTQAQATLAEGRDKVAGLRAQQESAPAFHAALEQLACAVMRDSATAIDFCRTGRPWRFSDAVATECLAIAAEAMTNVRNHAGARTMQVDLRYRWDACTIVIGDDGRGIAPDLVAGRAGHWGLAGMRERAALMHARFAIDTTPFGTTVTLRIGRWRARGPISPAPSA